MIFKLYAHWTCWAWIFWAFVSLAWFGVLESLGLKRWRGAIPLTWVVRDSMPQWALILVMAIIFGLSLWHFGIVSRMTQPLK